MSDQDTLAVTLTLTQQDYAKALKALGRKSLANRILFWVSVVFLAYMSYQLLRTSHGWLYALSVPVSVGALIFILSLLLRYWAARNFVKKNHDKLGPARHEIGPDGITNHGRHGEGTSKWTAFYQIRETPNLFLLYTQSTFSLIVPKRCFANTTDVSLYREIVRKYYTGKKSLMS